MHMVVPIHKIRSGAKVFAKLVDLPPDFLAKLGFRQLPAQRALHNSIRRWKAPARSKDRHGRKRAAEGQIEVQSDVRICFELAQGAGGRGP